MSGGRTRSILCRAPAPASGMAAFEEREAVRVEQRAPALRQADRAAGAVVARGLVILLYK